MPKAKSTIQIKNRRASFDYEFLETYTAGIQLVGTEIKSIRAGKASLRPSGRARLPSRTPTATSWATSSSSGE